MLGLRESLFVDGKRELAMIESPDCRTSLYDYVLKLGHLSGATDCGEVFAHRWVVFLPRVDINEERSESLLECLGPDFVYGSKRRRILQDGMV